MKTATQPASRSEYPQASAGALGRGDFGDAPFGLIDRAHMLMCSYSRDRHEEALSFRPDAEDRAYEGAGSRDEQAAEMSRQPR
jgi:hypothetical protein